MALSYTHSFTSAKSDGGDATLIQPSKWNASHVVTCATSVILGRATAGNGSVEELATTAFFQSLLNSADLPSLLVAMGAGAFTTGDVKFTIKTAADAGWVMMNDGTIGDGSSGATTRANADTSALFTVLWNNISNTWAPIFDSAGVASTRGGSAAADFAAHKRLALPKALGRALASAGAGATLTSRALGETGGAETVTLDSTMIPSHTHTATVTDPGHKHQSIGRNTNSGFSVAGGSNDGVISNNNNVQSRDTTTDASGVTVTNATTGGGLAHANMQPSVFLNTMIKL